jgi:hypothetical protein
MPQVNRFFKLPIAIQQEIEKRLMENGFSDYIAIADELKARGHRVSKSGLHRRGQELKEQIAKDPSKRFAMSGANE